jgi:hypothetical protein
MPDARGAGAAPAADDAALYYSLRVAGAVINIVFWMTLISCCASRLRSRGERESGGSSGSEDRSGRGGPRRPPPARGVPVALPVSCPGPREGGADAGAAWSQPMAYLPGSSFLAPKAPPRRGSRWWGRTGARGAPAGAPGGGGGPVPGPRLEECVVVGTPVAPPPGPASSGGGDDAAAAGTAARPPPAPCGGEWVEIALVSDEGRPQRPPAPVGATRQGPLYPEPWRR